MGTKKTISEKELNIQIGERLREIRENLGYTREEFADILCVAEGHYKRYETGATELPMYKVKILHSKLNIDPTYLIIGEMADSFDLDVFMANSTREQRDQLFKRVFEYMERLLVKI
ncbi:MAG: helix-turn-helix transcriptional regulator [Clostridiales bacterium]|nr:helix-turn-helix transcriptional regulator [Clostridiales bacterium]